MMCLKQAHPFIVFQGKTFKERIQQFYSQHPLLHSKFIPWSKTAEGKTILKGYIEACERNFHYLLQEIRGTADGAGLPFEQVTSRVLNKSPTVKTKSSICGL